MIRDLKDFDARQFYAIFDTAKKLDTSRLNGKKLSDIVNALVSWFDIWSKPGWFDAEHMIFAGRYLAWADRAEFEQAVCEWANKTPSQERFAVMGAYLTGFWQVKEPSAACVDFLRQAIEHYPADTSASTAIALALSVVKERKQDSQGI